MFRSSLLVARAGEGDRDRRQGTRRLVCNGRPVEMEHSTALRIRGSVTAQEGKSEARHAPAAHEEAQLVSILGAARQRFGRSGG